MTGHEQPETVVEDDAQAAALAELDKLGPAGDAPQDAAPETKRRRSRSGTSGAERARRAKAGGASSSSAPKAGPAPRARRATAPKIGEGMAQLYVMLGMAASVVPTPKAAEPFTGTVSSVVGEALVANSKSIGAAWEEAAKNDPRIREALEKLLTVSTFGQIVAAHMPVLMAGLMASGTVSPALFAGLAPDAP